MGCNIHLFIEYRHDSCPWQADHHHILDKERDYDRVIETGAAGQDYVLFGKLAGVRTYYKDSLDPRGIPENASPMIKRAIELYDDGHSHSWVTFEELYDIIRKLRYKIGRRDKAFFDHKDCKTCEDYGTWGDIINYCKKLKKKQEQVDALILGKGAKSNVQIRLVFFFDS